MNILHMHSNRMYTRNFNVFLNNFRSMLGSCAHAFGSRAPRRKCRCRLFATARGNKRISRETVRRKSFGFYGKPATTTTGNRRLSTRSRQTGTVLEETFHVFCRTARLCPFGARVVLHTYVRAFRWVHCILTAPPPRPSVPKMLAKN